MSYLLKTDSSHLIKSYIEWNKSQLLKSNNMSTLSISFDTAPFKGNVSKLIISLIILLVFSIVRVG